MDPGDSRGVGNIGKYVNLALLLPGGIFIGYLMGYGLDMLFHTLWLRYVFLVLGTIGGFVELLRQLDRST